MSNYSLFKIIEFLLFRAISNVMNALLGDLGFTDPTDIITKDKVRRLKIAHGYALQVEHEELGGYEFIGFDGMFNFVIFYFASLLISYDVILNSYFFLYRYKVQYHG